ncbi:hypothetical protein SAMN05421853_11212 [Roseivivax halotolerans]|uniref:Metanogen output domain-containing protein n=1 Tax=Roseivivax halotolerans TaxID=93684 RepID=A0A1I5ZT76_9RHOB|nr:methanogen output domain 1-containing protein [Roseivivax halotolerans]SFQ59397.1 hypothetical protein SAMN05421853_11212 [Roseivivax halotolerans]
MSHSLDQSVATGAACDLKREDFFCDTLVNLAGTLENYLGIEDASTFIARVGGDMGDAIGALYVDSDGALPQEIEAIGAILIDLKARIGGRFRIETISPTELVLINTACPFADRVVGHPSLCMMTTSVFGRIVSDATGYARVHIDEAIATGHGRCRVVVSLRRETSDDGHEFFG